MKAAKPSEARSRIMRAVRSANTGAEQTVVSWLKSRRFKMLLNARDLPGSPDIVLPARKVAIFVHGCFWHGHGCKRGARVPLTNTEYWINKITKNRKRDATVHRKLRLLGWTPHTVWECQLIHDIRRQKLLTEIKSPR